VLKRIFDPMRDNVIRGWTKIPAEKTHNLNSSQNIIRIMNSRGMRIAGLVDTREKIDVHTQF
jgi:hypothetical protein